MTDFICAYFGKGSDGKEWTITARGFGSLRQAESHGKYMMPMAGCFGFAVIEEDMDCWNVDWDCSMLSGKETVTRDDYMNFAVAL